MPTRRLYTRRTIVTITLIAALLVAAFYTGKALAREGTAPHPIQIPPANAKARASCPFDKPLKCRAALVRAYEAIAWQQKQNLELAREMVGKLTDWTCIHNGHRPDGSIVGSGEGAWNDTGDPYWGGLQMDLNFMLTYGRDMIRRHHGGLANTWTPREQIIVAQRAFSQNRGYNPWPNTARDCGLR